MRQLLRTMPDPSPTPAFWPGLFLRVRERRPSPKIRSLYDRAHQQTALGISIVLIILGSLVLAPHKVDDALQQTPAIHPYLLISLHAYMRNDQPLADSGSLQYTMATFGHLDLKNDDAARSD
jgi:hypothetical protein